MSDHQQRLKVLAAGVISLILTLGIARFSYTPLLPIMQQQAGLGTAEGGWLAAINYVGYLCGALLASCISNLVIKDWLYRIGLIVAIATTAGMALTENLWLWSTLRFFAGLSSAAGMLLGSGLILNWLIRHNHRSELGIHFSGGGLGIAICAIAVALWKVNFDWREQWLLLAMLGGLLAIPAWRWLPKPDSRPVTNSGQPLKDNPPSRRFVSLLMAAYFCAGCGYVVSATFIVAIVDRQAALQGQGELVFMVIGLSAAPACILWDLIARRSGTLNALILAFALQILGILLPVTGDSLTIALLSAVLYGGTFIGIVSLVLTMAGRFYPSAPAKLMGKMTISYGMAQIIAPAVTGLLAERSGSYQDGLYLAAAIMVVGTLLMAALRLVEKREASREPVVLGSAPRQA